MTQRQNELLVRWAIFPVVGVVLFLLMNPLFYRTRIRSHSTVNLSDVGVSIQTGGEAGTTVVRVDDREETIPTGKLGSTALSKEAMERVASNMKLGEKYKAFSWTRFIRWWGLGLVLTYWLLFRVWSRTSSRHV